MDLEGYLHYLSRFRSQSSGFTQRREGTITKASLGIIQKPKELTTLRAGKIPAVSEVSVRCLQRTSSPLPSAGDATLVIWPYTSQSAPVSRADPRLSARLKAPPHVRSPN